MEHHEPSPRPNEFDAATPLADNPFDAFGREFHSFFKSLSSSAEKIALLGVIVNVLSLVILTVYAAFTLFLWKTARATLSETHLNFVADQRPFVWLESRENVPAAIVAGQTPKSPVIAIPSQRIFWNFYYTNYGKTPALKAVGAFKVFYGMNAMEQADAFLKQLPARMVGLPPTVLMPNSSGQHFSTAVSDGVPSSAEYVFLTTHDFGVVLAGRFEYEDSAGNFYRSEFCDFTFLSGAIASCPTHNDLR